MTYRQVTVMHNAIQHITNFHVYAAIIIFIITYFLIMTEKINRASAALLGAILMILLGIVDFNNAITEHIQWETIVLLMGMMILVGITNKTGVFQYAAIKSAKIAKGDPVRILVILSILTGVGSAFLDNVTTVLLIVPVTFSITTILNINPFPFLISEVLFSNIGGTATLIGDPPNIMIGAANPHLDFNAFLLNLAPAVLIIGVVTLGILVLIYRKKLKVEDSKKQELMSLNEKDYIQDSVLMKKSLTVLVLTILGFTLHSVLHIDAAMVAITGAAVLLVIGLRTHDEVESAFDSVEWTTIIFFAGLFVLVGGLIDVGIIKKLAAGALNVTDGNIALSAYLILWISGIASAVIDNIPFVATMIPLIQDMAHGMGMSPDSAQINVLWWSLALGACLGGNGTLIGASANVIVAGMAVKKGHKFSFMDFLKIGAPIMLVSLLISTLYIFLRYLLFL
ncbi:Na+/H+ antiporter NhaD/arsenite permease-like protein [Priestia megaterium]|jgi:Na+/H+ antiporter NhaD/arsenite permease-like protein